MTESRSNVDPGPVCGGEPAPPPARVAGPEPPLGRVQSARLLADRLRANLEAQRPQHASVEVLFRWLLRDQEIAGGVLGGGLAYRFFFWMLALSLLFAGGLGFAAESGTDVAAGAEDTGLGKAMASTVAEAAEQSQSARWWLILAGSFFVLWFSWGLLRALRLVHVAAWRIAPQPLRKGPLALAAVIAAPLVLAAVSAGAGWVRANIGLFPGLVATLALAFAFGALWLWVSGRLPSPAVPWHAFLPGAAVFAVGLLAMHVFTVYFLAEKIADQSELYGALGLAASALFFLFLVGRGVVWAAELNAVVWEVRRRRDAESAGRT
jgi:uncharacterized BrkB/YihY/UPF0761 family membrane protein